MRQGHGSPSSPSPGPFWEELERQAGEPLHAARSGAEPSPSRKGPSLEQQRCSKDILKAAMLG